MGRGAGLSLQKRPQGADGADVILRLRDRASRILPEGRLLPEDVWQRRHRAIVRLCLASAALLVLFGWFQGAGQPAAVAILLAVGGPALLAGAPGLGRKSRAAATTVSL